MQNPYAIDTPEQNNQRCGKNLEKLDRIAEEIERLSQSPAPLNDKMTIYIKYFDDFARILADLRLCQDYATNPSHYFRFFYAHLQYIRRQFINISEFITEQRDPTLEMELELKEYYYCTLVSLFKRIGDKKSASVTLSRVVVMYTQLMQADHRFKSSKIIHKTYDMIREAIELSLPDRPPPSMDITYAFVAYAQLIQRENPVDALEIFEHANRYAEQGSCKHLQTHYFCLIELASIYYQACDNRNKYFKRGKEEVSDNLEALLLQGVNFALKAVALIRLNRLDIRNERCQVLLADLYYQLGIQAENQYSSPSFIRENISDIEQQIIEWYTQSIHWAHQARQKDLELKGVNQLAWFLYRHTQSRRAIELCQNAIRACLAEAETRRDFPLSLNKYRQQFEAYKPTNQNSAKEHLIFYTDLLNDLIKLEVNRSKIDSSAKRFKDNAPTKPFEVSREEESPDLRRKNAVSRTAPSFGVRR